ncbi:hypothetical protein GC163_22455 [bacterium]|nr:hypothetical protein [bacterium]
MMKESLHAPARALRFVAVGQLQNLASRTPKLFYQERYLRAADNLLKGIFDAEPDPDLASLGNFSDEEIQLAIADPVRGESARIVVLRQAAVDLRCRKLVNVKKTIRRRWNRQKQLPRQGSSVADGLQKVDDRLDCADLIKIVTPRQRTVLELRLAGFDDVEIASITGLSRQNVAVIAYRAHQRICEYVAATSKT